MNQKKQITGMYDYMPFGQQIKVKSNNSKDRLSFIGKENDAESGLGDFGVRKNEVPPFNVHNYKNNSVH